MKALCFYLRKDDLRGNDAYPVFKVPIMISDILGKYLTTIKPIKVSIPCEHIEQTVSNFILPPIEA